MRCMFVIHSWLRNWTLCLLAVPMFGLTSPAQAEIAPTVLDLAKLATVRDV